MCLLLSLVNNNLHEIKLSKKKFTSSHNTMTNVNLVGIRKSTKNKSMQPSKCTRSKSFRFLNNRVYFN